MRIGFADGGRELRFVDQRTFGGLLLDRSSPPRTGRPRRSRPSRAHRPRPARPALRRRAVRRPGCAAATPAVKRALLDQTLVSGVGNIYADEALWRARLHGARLDRHADPRRQVAELLAPGARRAGRRRSRAGGTSFDALYVNVNGESGYFDRSLAVYGREGEPCPRCGTPIRREPFMNRSSFFCPRCQRRAARPDAGARPQQVDPRAAAVRPWR